MLHAVIPPIVQLAMLLPIDTKQSLEQVSAFALPATTIISHPKLVWLATINALRAAQTVCVIPVMAPAQRTQRVCASAMLLTTMTVSMQLVHHATTAAKPAQRPQAVHSVMQSTNERST